MRQGVDRVKCQYFTIVAKFLCQRCRSDTPWLHLDNTPDAFLAEFDKRDRKFRKDKALVERWKSVEFLFQIADDEVRNAGAQGTLFDSGYDRGNYQSYLFFALDLKKNHYTRSQLADITREINLLSICPLCCSYVTMVR